MPQTGFSPIQHYRSTTALAVPSASDLAAGELALNLVDEKLYMKNASGVVKLLASTAVSSGTVTSVDGSGGTTGLTLTGGPITNSGTLTLGGTLAVANGGTGSTTAANARTALGAAASGAVVSSGITMSTARLLGRTTGGTGAIEEITIGANLTLTAGVLAASGGGGGGTVTSVNVSGGTTGLSFSGGPITTSGTITMAGTLAVANGGTGVTGSTGSGGNFVLAGSPTFTGNVNFGDGTAAAPGIRFAADTDTGIYRPGGNQIGFAVNGAAVGAFDVNGFSTGVVTVNTALRAADGSAATPSISFTNDTNTGFYSAAGDQLGVTVGGTLRVTFTTTAVTSTVPVRVPDGSAGAPSLAFASDTDTGFYLESGFVKLAVGGVQIVTFNAGAGNTLSVPNVEASTLLTCGSLRINTAPTVSVGTASTHKVAVNINGTTYYLLMTNVP